MEQPAFETVLGHTRVMTGALPDARRRVLAYDGDVVIGVATYEPLFGRQAEAAIAVAPGSAGSLVSFLLDGLLELATNAGVTVLRFVLGPGQRAGAGRLVDTRAACALRSDRLEVRLDGAPAPSATVSRGAGGPVGAYS
ncbi:MAG: hypothetical protein AAGC46_17275 [Solirubrobacteraceae bacterium]|nr:hypothetical protein [Patulibacter sp.]